MKATNDERPRASVAKLVVADDAGESWVGEGHFHSPPRAKRRIEGHRSLQVGFSLKQESEQQRAVRFDAGVIEPGRIRTTLRVPTGGVVTINGTPQIQSTFRSI